MLGYFSAGISASWPSPIPGMTASVTTKSMVPVWFVGSVDCGRAVLGLDHRVAALLEKVQSRVVHRALIFYQ